MKHWPKKKNKFIDKLNIYAKLERETTWIVATDNVGDVLQVGLHFGQPICERPHYKFLLLHTKATSKQYHIYLAHIVSILLPCKFFFFNFFLLITFIGGNWHLRRNGVLLPTIKRQKQPGEWNDWIQA